MVINPELSTLCTVLTVSAQPRLFYRVKLMSGTGIFLTRRCKTGGKVVIILIRFVTLGLFSCGGEYPSLSSGVFSGNVFHRFAHPGLLLRGGEVNTLRNIAQKCQERRPRALGRDITDINPLSMLLFWPTFLNDRMDGWKRATLRRGP